MAQRLKLLQGRGHAGDPPGAALDRGAQPLRRARAVVDLGHERVAVVERGELIGPPVLGAVPDIGLVQKEIDEAVELKVLPKPVKIDPQYVDLSLIEEAKKRLDGR